VHKSLQGGANALRCERFPPQAMWRTAAKVLRVTFQRYVLETEGLGLLQQFLIKAKYITSGIALADWSSFAA
jgi:hypothetical protein